MPSDARTVGECLIKPESGSAASNTLNFIGKPTQPLDLLPADSLLKQLLSFALALDIMFSVMLHCRVHQGDATVSTVRLMAAGSQDAASSSLCWQYFTMRWVGIPKSRPRVLALSRVLATQGNVTRHK